MTAAGDVAEPGVVRHRVRAADGVLLAVDELRPDPDLPGLRTALLVAGGPGRAAAYLGDLGGLRAHARVLRPDPRGSGGSRPADPSQLTLPAAAADLHRVCQELAPGTGALLVAAHSFGCRVLAHALAHPPATGALRPDAAVLITPPPPAHTAQERAALARGRADVLARHRAALTADPDGAFHADTALALDAATELAAAEDLPPRERARLEPLTRPLWWGRWDAAAQADAELAAQQTPTRTAFALRASAQLPEHAPEWSAVSVPTLILAGERDLLSPPLALRAMTQRLPTAELVVLPAVGHYPWREDPAGMLAALTGFLRGLPGAGVPAAGRG